MGKNLKGREIGKGLSQRKNGLYEARCVIGGVKVDLYDKNLATLKKRFEMEKAKILRKEYTLRPDLTFSEWWNEWFETVKSPQLKSDISRKVYFRKVNNTFCRILGAKKIADITQLDVQRAANDLMEEGYAKKTVGDALSSVRLCMESASLNRLVLGNPCCDIKLADKNTGKQPRYLTHEEQQIFLEEAKNSFYYEIYRFLLLSGLRIGELGALTWDAVNFEKEEVYISKSLRVGYYDGHKIQELSSPKTANGYRIIPFFAETRECLLNWKRQQDEWKKRLGDRWFYDPELGDLLFTTSRGTAITRYNLQSDINSIVDEINKKEVYTAMEEHRKPEIFKPLSPHCFRHTFATRLAEKQIVPGVVQKLCGHKGIQTTMNIYTHLEDTIHKETAKIGKLLD